MEGPHSKGLPLQMRAGKRENETPNEEVRGAGGAPNGRGAGGRREHGEVVQTGGRGEPGGKGRPVRQEGQ